MPKSIGWPDRFTPDPTFNAVGAIDCTPHFRVRVHPGSLDYYRGDLKDYSLTAQLIVSLKGDIWSVIIKKGHHNDMGVFNLSRMDEILIEKDIYLLGDLGYSTKRVITPQHTKSSEQSVHHRQLRAIVERVFGFVKNWDVAGERCRLTPENKNFVL